MTHTAEYDVWTRRFAAASALLLALLFVLIVVASVRSPSVNERLDRIEQNQQFQSCLLLVPVDARPDAVSECVAPDLVP